MQEYKQLEAAEKKLYKNIKKLYGRELTSIQKELAAYYQKYGTNNIIEYRALLEQLTPAERDLLYRDFEAFAMRYPQYSKYAEIRAEAYKINRLEGLEANIRLNQYKQGMIEAEEYQKHLEKMTRLGYNSATNGQSAMIISDRTVRLIASDVWGPDKDIAAEILGKKAAEAEKMFNAIKNGFVRGDSYSRMAKTVEERFEVNYKSAKRWIYTEGTRVMSEGKAQGFQDMGYTKYIFRTMEDDRVCDICDALNGEEFSFADRSPGDNFPPMHANCRCTFEVINTPDEETNGQQL